MPQTPPIEDAYIDEIIKSAGPYNPGLNTTQGVKLRELMKHFRDYYDQQTDIDLTQFYTKAQIDNLITMSLTPRTVSTLPPTGIPQDGEEWIMYSE